MSEDTNTYPHRHSFVASYTTGTGAMQMCRFGADSWEEAVREAGNRPNWPGGNYELSCLVLESRRNVGSLEMTPISDPRD